MTFVRSFIAGSGLVIALAIGVSTAACAQSSPAPPNALAFPITKERHEAVGFAITHSLVIEKLLNTCATIKQTLPEDPEEALKAWAERNGERLEAAYGFLFYVRAITTSRQGKEAGEAFYKGTTEEYEKRAAAGLSEVFTLMVPNTATCAKWVKDIATRKADLDWKPQYTPVLDEIVAFHRSVMGKAKP